MTRQEAFKSNLAPAGVDLIDDYRLILECEQWWSPKIEAGGRLRRGYRRCPNGCSADQLANR